MAARGRAGPGAQAERASARWSARWSAQRVAPPAGRVEPGAVPPPGPAGVSRRRPGGDGAQPPAARWRLLTRDMGLRPRLTLVSTAVVALVSALLLWLGWLLVGGVARAMPSLPPGTTVRVGNVSVPAEQLNEVIGEAARADVLRAGLIAFPLVVLAAAVVSWVLVGRVLGPLHAVTATARRLTAESLDTRTGLRDAHGEVAELAAGFDAMLDRLQAAFDAQRRFVANASHELRTPLAVMCTEVDVTLADPDADVAELRRMGAGAHRHARRFGSAAGVVQRSGDPRRPGGGAVRTVSPGSGRPHGGDTRLRSRALDRPGRGARPRRQCARRARGRGRAHGDGAAASARSK